MKTTRLLAVLTAALFLSLAFSEETITFTNCGQEGRYGPSQEQCNVEYGSGVVNVVDGIQQWTAPYSGFYTIEVNGAQGGRSDEGYGVKMIGDFNLVQGTILKVLVGQKGGDSNGSYGDYGECCPSNYLSMSGGGGTFVSTNDNIPLIIAGGGGGRRNPNANPEPEVTNGTISNNGMDGSNSSGGFDGGGGTSSGAGGGAGAGFFGDGVPSPDNRPGPNIAPSSFVNGGYGGFILSDYLLDDPASEGGFGGGASGAWGGAGGAGGYSGGGSDNNSGYSGGGGSFIADAAELLLAESGVNEGHGYVVITRDNTGCMDPDACNYDPEAIEDDGSCAYEYDCAGECGSSAEVDDCGVCDGGNADMDCEGVCDGAAVVDCAGTCSGSAVEDECGTCDSDTSNDCAQDCLGAWGGDAQVDDCGVCDGGNADMDCAGVCDGAAVVDCASECDGDDFSCADCCGVPNGAGDTCDGECGPCNDEIDEGACDCYGNVLDCNDECGGSAVVDYCGVCGGFNECFDNVGGESITLMFTSCGQTGYSGPDQSQCENAYIGTDLEGQVTLSGGIQYWTVPFTGIYSIEAEGAQGGDGTQGNSGGLGAWVKGDIPLVAGATFA